MKFITQCLFVIFTCFFFLSLQAKPADAVLLSPASAYVTLTPGKSTREIVRLTNLVSEVQTYKIIFRRLTVDGEEQRPVAIDADGEDEIDDLRNWIVADETTVTLQPNETRSLEYTINTPVDAEPGGHYAIVFAIIAPPEASELGGSGAMIGSRVGQTIWARVEGDIIEQANMESFTTQGFFSHLPVSMSARIMNSGNVHVRPNGKIIIRNIFGGIVQRLDFNAKGSFVFPRAIRRIETTWSKSDKIAQGGFWAGVVNEWRNFAIGRYTATIDATYGADNKALEQMSVSFWVFPWHLLVLIFGGLALLWIIMKIYNQSVVDSAMKKKRQNK